jgi:hypothetical protein
VARGRRRGWGRRVVIKRRKGRWWFVGKEKGRSRPQRGEGHSGSRVRGSVCCGRALESRIQLGQWRSQPVGGILPGQLVDHRFSAELVVFEWQPIMNGDTNEQGRDEESPGLQAIRSRNVREFLWFHLISPGFPYQIDLRSCASYSPPDVPPARPLYRHPRRRSSSELRPVQGSLELLLDSINLSL